MPALGLSLGKRVNEALKASCRALARSILPILPDSLTSRLPFLGRVSIAGPNQLRLHLHTHGPHGKDRIALKLAKRGLWGYEGETLRLYLPLARQARVVVDIGANTGLYALVAAAANPACRVWAFEPVPFIFSMLQNNIALNQLANVEAVPSAVADVSGETTFFITRTHVGIPTDSSACAGFRADVEELRVPTITLDDYVAQNHVPHLDLVKIDAEATESSVIRGARQTLRTHRPFVICEVVANVDHHDLQQTFESLDYRFFHIGPDAVQHHPRLLGSLEVNARNYVLVPTEKQALLAEACQAAGVWFRDERGTERS